MYVYSPLRASGERIIGIREAMFVSDRSAFGPHITEIQRRAKSAGEAAKHFVAEMLEHGKLRDVSDTNDGEKCLESLIFVLGSIESSTCPNLVLTTSILVQTSVAACHSPHLQQLRHAQHSERESTNLSLCMTLHPFRKNEKAVVIRNWPGNHQKFVGNKDDFVQVGRSPRTVFQSVA